VASEPPPVIRYSPWRYLAVVATGLACFGLALVYGALQGEAVAIAVGVAGLLLVGLFTLGVKDKLRDPGPALARDGDLLVGGELRRALPIAETTFEIVPDNRGSWVIVLRSPQETVRLAAGGWRIAGERRVSKAVAERALMQLGLARRT
jgi:hypothetical protein